MIRPSLLFVFHCFHNASDIGAIAPQSTLHECFFNRVVREMIDHSLVRFLS